MTKKTYYCEYCGHKYYDLRQLTTASCVFHPNGRHRGNHKLYEGSEKSQYTCKYCGEKFRNISAMHISCVRHPDGSHKGNHIPAL